MTLIFTLALVAVIVGCAVGLVRSERREAEAARLDRQLAASRWRDPDEAA